MSIRYAITMKTVNINAQTKRHAPTNNSDTTLCIVHIYTPIGTRLDNRQLTHALLTELTGNEGAGDWRSSLSRAVVPSRVFALPLPCGPHDIVDSARCLPPQFLLCLCRISHHTGQITRPACANFVWNFSTGMFLKSFDHLEHTEALACAEVVRCAATVRLFVQKRERCQMSCSEVFNMKVVSHSGAVGGVVVITKDSERLAPTYTNLLDVRHQIVWWSKRVLSDQATVMCANRVEVAQHTDPPSCIRVGQIPEELLSHQLGVPVRVAGT